MLANATRGFFNSTTPRNTNVDDGFSFNVPTTVDEVAQEFGGATVITEANTTTTAQQTGIDSQRRSVCGSTPTRRSKRGNLKSPNKYNN